MNNCLGYRKARALTGSLLKNEQVNIKLINIPKLNLYPSICNWFKHFLTTLPHSLILDRHYNNNIEHTVRLSNHKFFGESFNYSNEINEQSSYELRRIPIILLRGYFNKINIINFCLKKCTYDSFKRCLILMESDNFYKYDENKSNIDEYYENANEYFKLIIELSLLSFEKCFHIIVNKLYKKEWLPLVNLFENINTWDYWKGINLPNLYKNKDDIINSGCLLLFVILWRINATLVIEKELFFYYYNNSTSSLLCNDVIFNHGKGNLYDLYDSYYSKKTPKKNIDCKYHNQDKSFKMENVRYNFLLFRDTHLPLLTIIIKNKNYYDLDLSYNGILMNNYPSSFNICCIDELPDMTSLLPLMNTWYDTGTKRETSEYLIDAMRHIYTIKPVNRICLIRNISKMLNDYSKKYPIVIELFKLTMKCVLLGNLPYAKNPLDLNARIHVYSMYDKDNIIFEEKGNNVNDWVLNWTNNYRYFTLFILREYLFYTCENQKVLIHTLSKNYKWDSFVLYARYANGDVRKIISKQCHTLKDGSKIDWKPIEHREKLNPKDNERKSGILKGYHTQTLEFADKLKKYKFTTILQKRMRSIEPELDIQKLNNLVHDESFIYQTSIIPENSPLYRYQKKKEIPINSTKFYLNYEQFHFLCWCVAQRKRPFIETKWLHLLNMSEKGIKTVKDLILSYYEYNKPDNSFKKQAKKFFNESPIDYLLLKIYLKTVEFYNDINIFYLPYDTTLNQFNAIRKSLRLEKYETTPLKSGFGYLCMGCHRWANKITDSYDNQDNKKNKKICKCDKNEDEKVNNILNESTNNIDIIQPDNTNKKPVKKKPNTKKRNKKSRGKRNGYATYLLTGLYDPLSNPDNGLYCKRGNYSRDYIVSNDIRTDKYDDASKLIKKNFNDIFQGFYINNDINENIETDNVELLFGNDDDEENNNKSSNEMDIDEDEDDDDDDDDDENKKKKGKINTDKEEKDDDDFFDTTTDILFGNQDNETISEKAHFFEKMQNYKIPNIAIKDNGNNQLSFYSYRLNPSINNNEIVYDDAGYPIESINITHKLIPTGDSYSFSPITDDDTMVIENNNTVKVKDINKLIGNRFLIDNTLKKDTQSIIQSKNIVSITQIINQVISNKFDCSKSLLQIDLVGIIIEYKKTNYGLCSICGYFIKICNNKFTSTGPTCGRHATQLHSFDNPIWKLDKDVHPDIKTQKVYQSKCLQMKIDEKYYAMNNKKITTQKRLILMFHYKDVTPKLSIYDDSICHYCKKKSFVYVAAWDHLFEIKKIPLCKEHTILCRSRYMKNAILDIKEIAYLCR